MYVPQRPFSTQWSYFLKSIWLLSHQNSKCTNYVYNIPLLSSLLAPTTTLKDLLKFWTGWEVPPTLLKLEVVRARYPTSATCYNTLKLPSHYTSAKALKEDLSFCLTTVVHGFGNMWALFLCLSLKSVLHFWKCLRAMCTGKGWHLWKVKGEDHPFSILNYVINIPVEINKKITPPSVLPRTGGLILGFVLQITTWWHHTLYFTIQTPKSILQF